MGGERLSPLIGQFRTQSDIWRRRFSEALGMVGGEEDTLGGDFLANRSLLQQLHAGYKKTH